MRNLIFFMVILLSLASCADDKITVYDNTSTKSVPLNLINDTTNIDTVLLLTKSAESAIYLTDLNHNIKYIVTDRDEYNEAIALLVMITLILFLFIIIVFNVID